jgi:HK97 family phage prohead protease
MKAPKTNRDNGPKLERRTINSQEMRSISTDSGHVASGMCIVYNSLSEDLGGFREKIAPGACTESLAANDIFLFFNHDSGKVLARTSAKTLTLTESPSGVSFEASLPNNSLGNDLAVSIERKDVTSCSFGFFCVDESWEEAADGIYIRTVLKANVFECSIVPCPAYKATNAQIDRSLFPEGIPSEVRSHVFPDGFPADDEDTEAPIDGAKYTIDARGLTPEQVEATTRKQLLSTRKKLLATRGTACDCDCEECSAGNCSDCSDPDCDDEECDCSMRSMRKSVETSTLRARIAKSL